MPVTVIGREQILHQGLISDEDWQTLKFEEAVRVEQEILSGAPLADEDPQIGWNFKLDWRGNKKIHKEIIFGSDFDYWNYVVDDAIALWKTWVAPLTNAYNDYIAESIAGWGKGVSIEEYAKNYAIWQNKVEVSEGTKLEGPEVLFGPTMDFSIFLERWVRGTLPNKLRVLYEVGAVHSIAAKLAEDWKGVHAIRVMVVAPSQKRTKANPIPNRVNPVRNFPLIGIYPRHAGT